MYLKRLPTHLNLDDVKLAYVVLTDENQNILVLRRSLSETTRPGQWEAPGGHREEGETLVDTAHRELWEETGLKFKITPNHLYFISPKGSLGILFQGKVEGFSPVPKLSGHDRYRWVSPEALSQLEDTPPDFIKGVKFLLGFHRTSMKKLSARQRAIKAATHSQHIFYSINSPRTESLWNLAGLRHPDLNKLSAHQEPTPLDRKLDYQTGDPLEKGITVHRLIRDALEATDATDHAYYTPFSDKTGLLKLGEPRSRGSIRNSLIRAGLHVKSRSADEFYVSLLPFKRSSTVRSSPIHYPARISAVPPAVPNVMSPQPMSQDQNTTIPSNNLGTTPPNPTQITLKQKDVRDPAKILQQSLGPNTQVQTDPKNQQITLTTNNPNETIQKVNQAIQNNKLPFALASKRAADFLRRRFASKTWFRGVKASCGCSGGVDLFSTLSAPPISLEAFPVPLRIIVVSPLQDLPGATTEGSVMDDFLNTSSDEVLQSEFTNLEELGTESNYKAPSASYRRVATILKSSTTPSISSLVKYTAVKTRRFATKKAWSISTDLIAKHYSLAHLDMDHVRDVWNLTRRNITPISTV